MTRDRTGTFSKFVTHLAYLTLVDKIPKFSQLCYQDGSRGRHRDCLRNEETINQTILCFFHRHKCVEGKMPTNLFKLDVKYRYM